MSDEINVYENPEPGQLFQDDEGDIRLMQPDGTGLAVKVLDNNDVVRVNDEIKIGTINEEGNFVALSGLDVAVEENKRAEEEDAKVAASSELVIPDDIQELADQTVKALARVPMNLLTRARLEDHGRITRSYRRISAVGIMMIRATNAAEKERLAFEMALAADTLKDIALKYDIAWRTEFNSILEKAFFTSVDLLITAALGPTPRS